MRRGDGGAGLRQLHWDLAQVVADGGLLGRRSGLKGEIWGVSHDSSSMGVIGADAVAELYPLDVDGGALEWAGGCASHGDGERGLGVLDGLTNEGRSEVVGDEGLGRGS